MSIKIGLFTSGYKRSPLEHAFEDAERFGYDYIELAGQCPHAYPPDLQTGGIDHVRRLIAKYDMPVRGFSPSSGGGIYNFMIGDQAHWRRCMEYYKLAMDMAKAMGAEFTLVSPGHAGYLATSEQIHSRLIASMKELEQHARSIGHKIVLEALTPFESNVCICANDLADVFRQVPSEHLVGMCDVVPPYVIQEGILTYFDKLGEKMQHIHLVDSDGHSDTHLTPGEGTIPMRELLLELREQGYCGTATIELVTNYIHEPRLYARKAIDAVRPFLMD